MNAFIKNTVFLAIIAVLLIACDSSASLQKYYVDSKENNEFISVDLPANILQLKDTEVSDDVKKVLNTIKKINFLALQLSDTNEDLYVAERLKIKEILKKPKYKELLRVNTGNGNVSVNYIGKEDAIDEIVIFGSDNEKGFALVRVLGENMNPSDILRLSQELKIDGDSNQLKQLEGLFSSF